MSHFKFILYFGIALVGASLLILFSAFSVQAVRTEMISLDSVWVWMQSNWASVGLVLSEIAALLPGKYSGILRTVVLIAGKVFNKKSKKS